MASTSYGQHIERIRVSQLPHWQDSLHLDATASAPVPRSILNAVHTHLLESQPPSNPHSNSPSGRKTREEIDNVRNLICNELFGVQRKAGIITNGKGQDAGWEVVFNSGTTAGLQLTARSFDFEEYGRFAYLDQSHSSLYGLRDIVQAERSSGAYGVDALREEEVIDWVKNASSLSGTGRSLLAIPLQCNATGKRYHRFISRILKTREEVERKTGERKVFILLDAASYLSPSCRMKLRKDCNYEVDFICFSFIKILGYPSGLGATLIQRASAFTLTGKSYYGGGTLEASTSRMQWRQPMRELHESLEDGTLNIHGILAVPPALRTIRSDELLGSWEKANKHVEHLTKYLWNSLGSLKHADGSPICELYSAEPEEWKDCNMLSQGPCILFNILRAQGTDKMLKDYRIDPAEVDRLACLDDIHIRSGRMCNVGAITASLGIKEEDVIALWNQGIGCGNIQHSTNASTLRINDPGEYARLATLVNGAVRVSVSAYNTMADIDKFVVFLEKYFYCLEIEVEEDLFVESQVSIDLDDMKSDTTSADDNSDESHSQSKTSSCQTSIYENANQCVLQKMFIYPIKSCAAQQIMGPWKIIDAGLEFDRDFCIVDISTGKVLSQKRVTNMARIRPQVCIEKGKLEIGFYSEDGTELQNSLSIPLKAINASSKITNEERQFEMCGISLHPQLIMDEEVRSAFSTFLGLDCTLARSPLSHRSADGIPIKLSNESPFLMISTESVAQICQWMKEDQTKEIDPEKVASAFRANFIISHQQSGEEAFYEDEMSRVRIGHHQFTVIGPCRRCEMIALDPLTGMKTPQVMTAIAKHRRCKESGPYKSKLLFGQHLIRHSSTLPTASDLIKPGMQIVSETN